MTFTHIDARIQVRIINNEAIWYGLTISTIFLALGFITTLRT